MLLALILIVVAGTLVLLAALGWDGRAVDPRDRADLKRIAASKKRRHR